MRIQTNLETSRHKEDKMVLKVFFSMVQDHGVPLNLLKLEKH